MLIMVKTKGPWALFSCLLLCCDFALEQPKNIIQKSAHKASGSGWRQRPASVSIHISCSASVQTLSSPLSLFLAVCLWRFVSLCSISGAANAHNVNYYNEPKQANQASRESQLSAELTFVYCLWLRFRLLPREQQSEARHEDKTV